MGNSLQQTKPVKFNSYYPGVFKWLFIIYEANIIHCEYRNICQFYMYKLLREKIQF